MASVPYQDLNGFTARTVMPASDIAIVVAAAPLFFRSKESQVRAWLNARLHKRYAVPFGTQASPLDAVGTTPPPAALAGTPALGSLAIVIAILVAGAVGTATFQWSADGGNMWTSSSALASSGTSPPAVTASGTSALAAPSNLVVQVTAGGTLGAALFQWSADGGQTWSLNPVLAATGTTPPAATVSGSSSLASPADLQIQITGAGALGTAAFRWSLNAGATWSSGLTAPSVPLPGTGLTVSFPAGVYATDNVYVAQGIQTAARVVLGVTGLSLQFPAGTYSANNAYVGQGIVTASSSPLPGTGLSVQFPVGTYATDNVFSASTPVLEVVLAWQAAILTPDMYRKRGVDPTDPQLVLVEKDRDRAFAEIKEAADSETGLFDLPLNDTSNAAATSRGGPLSYTETSPYVAADIQECIGRTEDGWYR